MPINVGSAEGYIDLDFSNFKKGVQSTISTLDKLDSAYTESESYLRKMEAEIKNSGGVFQAAAQKSKQLSSELNTAQKQADVYRKAIDGMNTIIRNASQAQTALQPEIQKTTGKLHDAEQKIKELSAAYKTAAKATKEAASAHGEQSEEAQKAAEAEAAAKEELDKAAKSADQYRNSLLQMQTQHAKLGQEIEGAKDKTTEFRTSLNNAEAKIVTLRQELYEAQSILVNFGTAAQNAGDKWQSASSKINKVGNVLTLGVTTPIIGIGTAAVKSGNEFEAQMSRVSAIAGAYGDDLEKLRQQAIDLGAETSFSATSAAEAMENLASAGFATQEIMEAMPGMLDLAASSGEDLASSADIAASTLRGFQLEASEAGHVADVLAKNAANTNAAILDTGYAMKYVAPVAQSVGWSLEEVTAAIGVLADAGIKGEQAGTTLRGALTRLMKPTDDMQKAMDSLGITFYDAEGKMKPLSTIVDELQKSTEGLTDEQRDNRLATIFGTEALSGMKVLLASSKEELDSLTEGLENADGASKKMADTMLDNTKGSIEEMNGSLETAAITIQKQLSPWITKGANQVTEWANKFAELDESTQGTILSLAGVAAAAGPVTRGIGGVTSGIGKLVKGTGGLIKDIGKLSSAKKAAQAIGSIGTFSANAVPGVSGLSKTLFNLGSPKGIAVLAGTAILGIGTAIYEYQKRAHEAALKADLEEHFGDVKLSAEEVEDVAKRLSTTDWTIKLDAYMDAAGKLDEYKTEIQSAVEEMNKLDWKVSVGMELTEEEMESYKQAVDSYVKSAQEYVTQKQYTVSLALQASFDTSSETFSNLDSFSKQYYSNASEKLETLGQDLADVINQAYEDGTFSDKQTQELIKQYRDQINKITQEIADQEYTASLSNLELQLTDFRADLTPESFVQINEEINKQVEELKKNVEAAQKETLIQINMRYDALVEEGVSKEVAQNFKDQAIREMSLSMAEDEAELRLTGINFSLETIKENYKEELNAALPEFRTTLETQFDRALQDLELGGKPIDQALSGLVNGIKEGAKNLEGPMKENISSLMDSIKPQIDDLTDIAAAFREAGASVPESISSGLLDAYQLEAMVGNTNHVYEILGMQISQSPTYLDALAKAVENGYSMPEGLSDGILMGSGLVYDQTEHAWQQVQAATEANVPELVEQLNQYAKQPTDEIVATITAGYPVIYDAAEGEWKEIENAAASKAPSTEEMMRKQGEKITSSMAGGITSRKYEVNEATGEVAVAVDDKLNSLNSNEWGSDMVEGYAAGVIESMESAVAAATSVAQGISAVLHFSRPDEGPLRNYEEWPIHFIDRYAELMESRRSKMVSAATSVAEGVRAAMSMEGIGKDLDMSLFRRADLSGTITVKQQGNTIDYDKLGATIARALQKSPLTVEAVIENQTTIEIDKAPLGKVIEPEVSRIMAKKARLL